MPTIQVNNVELYYETAGEGQPILLIHGLAVELRPIAVCGNHRVPLVLLPHYLNGFVKEQIESGSLQREHPRVGGGRISAAD